MSPRASRFVTWAVTGGWFFGIAAFVFDRLLVREAMRRR